MKNRSSFKKVFFSSIIVFIMLVAYFVCSAFSDITEKLFIPLVPILGIAFLISGVLLIFFSRKEEGRMKTSLALMGFSAISPFVFSILHNLFYALNVLFENFLFEFLHAVSFIISLLIAPLGFVVGAISCLILFRKKS